MPCPFPWRISDFYAGGTNVPVGTTGINGAIPSSGEIKFSDFYGSPLIQTQYVFVANNSFASGFTGIHTNSFISLPRFGVWVAPLPEIPNPPGNDINNVIDTVSGPILLPDTFTYGCGTVQAWDTTINVGAGTFSKNFLLSISRLNGSSLVPANVSWTPFTNIIINGPGWNNVTYNVSTLTKFVQIAQINELFFNINLPSSDPRPDFFTSGGTYTVTFN